MTSDTSSPEGVQSSEEMPQFVAVDLKEDVGLANLQSGGEHHVFGDDGTHVVLKVCDEENAQAQQRFRFVEDADAPTGLIQKIGAMFK